MALSAGTTRRPQVAPERTSRRQLVRVNTSSLSDRDRAVLRSLADYRFLNRRAAASLALSMITAHRQAASPTLPPQSWPA